MGGGGEVSLESTMSSALWFSLHPITLTPSGLDPSGLSNGSSQKKIFSGAIER